MEFDTADDVVCHDRRSERAETARESALAIPADIDGNRSSSAE
jgi:hypothetical protein